MNNRGNLNLIIAVLFVVVIFMGVGLSYISSRPVDNMIGINQQTEDVTPIDDTATASADITALINPAVTFEPDSAFSPVLRSEFSEKVVNPAIDYSTMIVGERPIQSVKIIQVQTGTQVRYSMEATHSDGSVATTPIPVDASGVSWWMPVCDNICIFPAAFAQKYPAIVDNYSK